MIKRLLLVLTIAGGVVMVPYWVGKMAIVITTPKDIVSVLGVLAYWISGIMVIVVCAFVLLMLGMLCYHSYMCAKKVFNYIRYGSFVLLLFLGLGVSGQTRSSGFIAIPAQEYFRLKDSVSKLNRVNDSLRKELSMCIAFHPKSNVYGGIIADPLMMDEATENNNPCRPDSTKGLNMFELQKQGVIIRIDERGVYGRYAVSPIRLTYLGNVATGKGGGSMFIYNIPKECPEALNHNLKTKK